MPSRPFLPLYLIYLLSHGVDLEPFGGGGGSIPLLTTWVHSDFSYSLQHELIRELAFQVKYCILLHQLQFCICGKWGNRFYCDGEKKVVFPLFIHSSLTACAYEGRSWTGTDPIWWWASGGIHPAMVTWQTWIIFLGLFKSQKPGIWKRVCRLFVATVTCWGLYAVGRVTRGKQVQGKRVA